MIRDAALEKAYRATAYVVDLPDGPVSIRIGQRCPRVDAWLSAHALNEWVFITAWNPQSEILDNKINELRNAALGDALRQRACVVFSGRGQPDQGGWTAEESLLALGISEADAVALGAQFGQHAVVTGRRGECAVLRWCTG